MLSTVTDKGQVTLPKALRDRLGIAPGTKIRFEVQADGTLAMRVLARGSAGLFALIARPGERARSQEEMDAGITAAVIERSRRKSVK